METKGHLWFAALLITSQLVFSPTILAAEKGGMMKDDAKSGMMEEKGGKMTEGKGEVTKDNMKDQKKSKAQKSEDKMKKDGKMKMDDKMKMEEKK